jgi:beta-1,4-N-acetylglucosaminyltransferase
VLGSGGHTSEMMLLLTAQRTAAGVDDDDDNDRSGTSKFIHYVLAETDTTSRLYVEHRERRWRGNNDDAACAFHTIPRSREVAQSYATSVLTTLVAIVACLRLVWRLRPRALLTNGPGTCVPVVAAAWLLSRLCLIPPVAIVFVESVCRVQTLSLTGRLVYPLADKFIVQWPTPELTRRYPRATYIGRLL